MSDLTIEMTRELGGFVENIEKFYIGLAGGTNVLFAGLLVVGVIGLIGYFGQYTIRRIIS